MKNNDGEASENFYRTIKVEENGMEVTTRMVKITRTKWKNLRRRNACRQSLEKTRQ